MKKLIPFDIELAKAGAKVVTTGGQPVKIVNFNLAAVPSFPVLGLVTWDLPSGLQEDYEVWPASGSYRGLDEIGRDNVPADLLIEVNYDDKTLLRYGRELEAKILGDKGMVERLEGELEASRHNYRAATIEIKNLGEQVDRLQRDKNSLEQWKKEALEVMNDWAKVENFLEENCAPQDLGKPIAAVALDRLRTLKDLVVLLKQIK